MQILLKFNCSWIFYEKYNNIYIYISYAARNNTFLRQHKL